MSEQDSPLGTLCVSCPIPLILQVCQVSITARNDKSISSKSSQMLSKSYTSFRFLQLQSYLKQCSPVTQMQI